MNETLLWDTPQHAWHSARVIMDQMGLAGLIDRTTGIPAKDLLCACIYQESQFHPAAIGKPNHNGTRDYGLCQYNDGHNSKGFPLWIGPGAAFSSIQEVINNPEKNVRIMVQMYKLGHLNWWSSYSTGAYKEHLLANSPMWALKQAS